MLNRLRPQQKFEKVSVYMGNKLIFSRLFAKKRLQRSTSKSTIEIVSKFLEPFGEVALRSDEPFLAKNSEQIMKIQKLFKDTSWELF